MEPVRIPHFLYSTGFWARFQGFCDGSVTEISLRLSLAGNNRPVRCPRHRRGPATLAVLHPVLDVRFLLPPAGMQQSGSKS